VVAAEEGPGELRDFHVERDSDDYVEFGARHWTDIQERFPNLFGDADKRKDFLLSANNIAVPNTAPPLMRYVVNPKDGCVEKQQDTQQPAHVPAVAAAAMAAVTAAPGRDAFFPNLTERDRERRKEEAELGVGSNLDIVAASDENGGCVDEDHEIVRRSLPEDSLEDNEFEQQLKAELEMARLRREEAVNRILNPSKS
jgi:hypothetical protein